MKHIGKSLLKKTKNAEVVEKSGLKTTIVRLIFMIIHTRTHHQWDSNSQPHSFSYYEVGGSVSSLAI